MKKYFLIAIISGFVTSCTNESSDLSLQQTKNSETTNFSIMERDADSLDTGGQGGTTPVKPPKP